MTSLDRFLQDYVNSNGSYGKRATVDLGRINQNNNEARLEGWFTAIQLRQIADAIEEKSRPVGAAASIQGSQP